ncbi:MAG: sugar phosphate isomerase/epimerase [Verrucomicrobiaceae bacterium]|nr:MAG: sugar phosphate isomerase/epimerase [Verrucomicrobiaceae bacterium]
MSSVSLPRIGTVIRPGRDFAASIREWSDLGFESFQLAWSLKHNPQVQDLKAQAAAAREAAEETGAVISALGIYGNPLREDAAGNYARDAMSRAIEAARFFGAEVVGCFAGRVPGRPVPDSMWRFQEVFRELARQAEGEGVQLAFENCLQGGNWERGETNIGFHPQAWELMFDAVPSTALGLEWEPCHLLCQMIDPLPVLDRWVSKVVHVHGKDGRMDRALLAASGTHGPEMYVRHRFPGLGETCWTKIFQKLRASGYTGMVDVEGGHDPVFRGDREREGQINARDYLMACRMRVADAAGYAMV